MMMTAAWGSIRLIRCRVSIPSIPGMRRSRRMTSKDWLGNFSSASSPELEISTS